MRLLILAVMLPCTALAAEAVMSADALAKYQKANASIQAREYAEAITVLNALAADYPRLAEIFASRCSAQAGTQRYAGAEADCAYALTLKPKLPAALYGLAVAQDALGQRTEAVASYRQYAELDKVQAPMRERALSRVSELSAAPPPAAPSSTGKLIVYRNHRFAGPPQMTVVLDNRLVGDLAHNQYVEIDAPPGEHLLELRGHIYDLYEMPRLYTHPVQLGGATVYANLDTSMGQVLLQEVPAAQAVKELQEDCTKAYSRTINEGSAVAPAVMPPAAMMAPMYGIAVGVAGAPPSCMMNTRGLNRCGYNCQLGSNGEVYCASRPDGRCAFNANGTWSCP